MDTVSEGAHKFKTVRRYGPINSYGVWLIPRDADVMVVQIKDQAIEVPRVEVEEMVGHLTAWLGGER